MSKYTYNTFTSLANEGSFISQLNENFSTLQTLLDLVVSRNGTSPNTMTAALDFNSQNANNIATLRCASLEINGVAVIPASGVTTVVGEIASDGSAASPSVYFASDTDTGLYRVGANAIGVACGGSKKAEFNSTGLTITGTMDATAATAATGTFTTLGSTNATITNITVSGTVSLPAFALHSSTTCTTQAPGDNSTKLASTAFVTAAIAAAVPDTPVVRQYKKFVYTTQTSSAVTAFSPDGSKPQNTEGYEIFAESFTPTAADSIIVVRFLGQLSASDNRPAAAIFKDSGVDALSVGRSMNADTNYTVPVECVYDEVSGSTSARTYKVRVASQGYGGGNVVTINRGVTTANPFGSSMVRTYMEITEYAP